MIKGINNYDTAIGELIVYTGINSLIFGGLYTKFGSAWIGITGMFLEIILFIVIISKIQVVELFHDRMTYSGFFSQKKMILLKENQVVISLDGLVRAPGYTRNYSLQLHLNGRKIVRFQLKKDEFERFYHETKEAYISWRQIKN